MNTQKKNSKGRSDTVKSVKNFDPSGAGAEKLLADGSRVFVQSHHTWAPDEKKVVRPRQCNTDGYGDIETRVLRATLKQKLAKRTHKKADGCWLFNNDKTQYGSVGHEGVQYKAHRLAYILHRKHNIPENLWVCHLCDVKGCVNPEHLYLGTPKQNSADYHIRVRLCNVYEKLCAEYEQLLQYEE